MKDKRLTCKVCGKEFMPWSNERKIIKTAEGRHFDTFDCPRCGCQIVVQERIIEGQSLVSNDDAFQTDTNDLFNVRFEFENRFDFDNFYNDISYIVRHYGRLSVAEVKKLVSDKEKINYTDTKYGWYSLNGVRVSKKRFDKYFIYMPSVRKLNLGD